MINLEKVVAELSKPGLTADDFSGDYRKYRAHVTTRSDLFQDYVAYVFQKEKGITISNYSSKMFQYDEGENACGFEIKHDECSRGSSNLYIETSEKAEPRPGGYATSGIYRKNNTLLFLIGNVFEIYSFDVKILKRLDHETSASGGFRFRHVENRYGTSKAWLLPKKEARNYALDVIIPGKGPEDLPSPPSPAVTPYKAPAQLGLMFR